MENLQNQISAGEFIWNKNTPTDKPKEFETIFFITNKILHIGYYYTDKKGGMWGIATNYCQKDGKIFPVTNHSFYDVSVSYWAKMPNKPF